MNFCIKDIEDGIQSKFKRRSYRVDNMMATSDIGKDREIQEDSILIMEHPKENIKLLAIADGMGGYENGEVASNVVVSELYHWFNKMKFKSYANLNLELHNYIRYISELVRRISNGGGSTLAMAIVLEEKTLLVNLGDSRIYLDKGESFEQFGYDHSLPYAYYAWGKIKNKDDMRFHEKNNVIFSSLGVIPIINSDYVDNDSYDNLFLFSDGLTDCLSEQKMKYIIDTNDKKDIDKILVDEALKSYSYQNHLDFNYYDEIYGGTDNTSCVALIKK